MSAIRTLILAVLAVVFSLPAVCQGEPATEPRPAFGPDDPVYESPLPPEPAQPEEESDTSFWTQSAFSMNFQRKGGNHKFDRLSIAMGMGYWTGWEDLKHSSILAGLALGVDTGGGAGGMMESSSIGLRAGLSLTGAFKDSSRKNIGPLTGFVLHSLTGDFGITRASRMDLGAPAGHPADSIHDETGTRVALHWELNIILAGFELDYAETHFDLATVQDTYWGMKFFRPGLPAGIRIGSRRISIGSYHREFLVIGVEVAF